MWQSSLRIASIVTLVFAGTATAAQGRPGGFGGMRAAPAAPRFAAPAAPRFAAPRFGAPAGPRFAAPAVPHFAVPASRDFVKQLQSLAAAATTIQIYDATKLDKL